MSNERALTTRVLDLEGKPTTELLLPELFRTSLRLDVIRRAVVAQQSRSFQPQGRDPMAGKRTTAESFGVGRALSRVPRVGGGGPLSGSAAFAPGTVGGRMAFPPVTRKTLAKLVNRRERLLALRSAIAATGSVESVKKRGHKLHQDLALPMVVTDELEKLSKSSEAKRFLQSVGLWDDIVRVSKSKTIRRSGRVHAVGPLIVLGEDRQAKKAFGNFEGVDVVKAKDLNVELLAPGASPGRLTVWSESAINTISGQRQGT